MKRGVFNGFLVSFKSSFSDTKPINMGAQQAKEGRIAISCNTAGNLMNEINFIANNSQETVLPGANVFGAGTSLRASRINKSKVLKETKSNTLNIFTEHNGNSNNRDANRTNH